MYESEFSWKLDTGTEIVVTCEGMPYERESQSRDGTTFPSAYPLTIGFYIKPSDEVQGIKTLMQIQNEYNRIEEYAVIVLYELAERERSTA